MRLTRITRLPSRLRRAGRYEIHAYWRRQPIVPDTVLYESFSGNGMLCNPEAIFRRLLADRDFSHFTHIWALTSLHEYSDTVREFRSMPNVRFVRYGSPAYLRALATSEYLINNATFPADFSKRDGQIYLNTWHGTPLKRMGYDIEGGALATANIIRNFVQADYLLAANPFMSDQMYSTGYKLKGIFRGKIIEEGYPRIDRQFLDADEVQAGRAALREAGIPLGDRRIVLYAPTWKGESFGDPLDDIDELLRRVKGLEARIDTTKYVVLLKTHQIVHRLARKRPELRRMLVSNATPTNVILGLTDILITDYSSIFYDFLPTGRPILFFAPDLDEYEGTRGLYVPPEEWPGPVSRTVEDLARDLLEVDRTGSLPEDSAERYRRDQSTYCSREDGNVTDRVVDIVFRGREEGRNIRRDHADGRIPILLYLGGMRANGITTSVLNLLNNIDHERFDVSGFFSFSRSRVALEKAAAIHPAVRQFPRVGGMNGSKLKQLSRRMQYRRGELANHGTDPVQRELWDDEWTRCFGASRFDYVIDFSGYGPFWSTLLLHSPKAVRSIWLHNDLAADAHREVNGKKNMLHSLTQVFTLYPEYDHLVSVSPALSDINRRKLAEYSPPEKFVSAINTADADPIVERAQEDLRLTTLDPETGEYPEWVDELRSNVEVKTFVTVGRLSPEKNQSRLIRAFARVHEAHPATRLVIVGAGPLADDLVALAASLGVGDSVILTGQQSNPHAIMAAADCFVLSSNYEGQPMVILEALVLGLPIVTVAFASAESALPAGVGLVVPQTDEALADGMTAFLRGEVPARPFDADEYNRTAVGQFSVAIGVPATDAGRSLAAAPSAGE
jgi:CDP-glycerol glycerophosphotransferase (TagB/SpsB family)/glycosyltransferase involved in cell wall biosynthesis